MKIKLPAAAGILCGTLIMGYSPVFAGAVSGTPAVIVDGMPFNAGVADINSKAYVPLEDFAEALGKSVSYDTASNTVYVSTPAAAAVTQAPAVNPAAAKGTRTNPYLLNETGTSTNTYGTVDFSMFEVIRGDAAWDIVYAHNKFHKAPAVTQEYVITKLKITAAELVDKEYRDIDSFADSTLAYSLYDTQNIEYDLGSANILPGSVNLGKGETGEIWMARIVNKDEPVLMESISLSGEDSVWFRID